MKFAYFLDPSIVFFYRSQNQSWFNYNFPWANIVEGIELNRRNSNFITENSRVLGLLVT